jgi:homoserine kinase
MGAALSIYNTVEVTAIREGLTIDVYGEGAPDIETNNRNLVYRAIAEVFAEVKAALPGLWIRQTNAIPLARGLGSSAACVAIGVMAANRMLGDPLSISRLIEIGTRIEGHPDNITPALVGGLTLSWFEGEEVRYLRLPDQPALRFVAVVPDIQVKTADARAVLPQKVDRADAVFNVGRAALLASALALGRHEFLDTATEDRLHQPHRASLVPGFFDVLEAARKAGAYCAFLSGSGSTTMALASDSAARGVGVAMQAAFEHHGVRARILTAAGDTSGTTYSD